MVGVKVRGYRRASRRLFRRPRRGLFRGRGRFRRFSRFRRFRRFSRRRVVRRGRFHGRGRKSAHGRVMRFLAVQRNNAPGIIGDLGPGGAVRTFYLCGVTDSSTATQNATGGTPPAGSPPTWGSYWRVPLAFFANTYTFGLPTSSLLLEPTAEYVTNAPAHTLPYGAQCGFSSNEVFRIGDLASSVIIPWATIYKEIRVRRINVKFIYPRVMRTSTSALPIAYNADPQPLDASFHRMQQPAAFSRGGDMVFMCTRTTGPVEEEMPSTVDLQSGSFTQSCGYALIKKNPRLRKRAVFRNDVAYGMRPVKFSFRPTVAFPKLAYAQPALLGTGTNNEAQGLLDTAPSQANARNPSTAVGYTYRTAPWFPMVMPAFTGVSSLSNAGTTGQASYGNITSSTSPSWADQVLRWVSTPLFGMYMGLQPTTAQQWPTNMRRSVSFELEFRGLRVFDSTSFSGGFDTYYKEWGPLPTMHTRTY